jgi:hypothetical protein
MPRIKGVTVFISKELLEKLTGEEVIGHRTYSGKVVYIRQVGDTEGSTRLLKSRVKVHKRRNSTIWDVIG